LGCGTGHLSAAIADRGATVVGVDRSAEMVEEARAAHPEVSFREADAREFTVEAPFDAVFSNAVLHWVDDDDQDAVLSRVADALRPGGRFVAEMGGVGNVGTVVEAARAELAQRGYETDNPWYFPSVGEYTPRLEEHGFEVRRAVLFDRPTRLEDGMTAWLEMFGDGLLGPVPDDELPGVVEAIADRLRPALYEDGGWTADYRRLRFRAVRE
jgi:trans-aconitate methyltransferase